MEALLIVFVVIAIGSLFVGKAQPDLPPIEIWVQPSDPARSPLGCLPWIIAVAALLWLLIGK